MPRKRSRLFIIMEILEALNDAPMTPTRLATVVNLPYDRMRRIIKDLEERGLIERLRRENSPSVTYLAITDRGVKLLRELRKLKKLLNDFDLDII
ncbi:MAG: winged helix-turn-helix transcriptional regulator [Desulfurococcales archaeon]|nr:winged helix-turn-helix transcriptional regulator [Desulfurococcales archaeon]